MQLRAVLLDLDGTLVDTAPDMVGSLNRVLSMHNQAPANIEQASKLVSNGGKALIEFGFGDTIDKGDIPDVDTLLEEFLTDYKEFVANDSYLYQGMLEVLEYCEANSLKCCLLYTSPSPRDS